MIAEKDDFRNELLTGEEQRLIGTLTSSLPAYSVHAYTLHSILICVLSSIFHKRMLVKNVNALC